MSYPGVQPRAGLFWLPPAFNESRDVIDLDPQFPDRAGTCCFLDVWMWRDVSDLNTGPKESDYSAAALLYGMHHHGIIWPLSLAMQERL
jgi:hypothetical protein